MSAYRDPEYLRLRPIVLAEEPYCVGYPEGVHEGELVPTTDVDHKRALAQGGPRTPTRADLAALCGSCNGRKGRDERRRSWRDR